MYNLSPSVWTDQRSHQGVKLAMNWLTAMLSPPRKPTVYALYVVNTCTHVYHHFTTL